MDSTGLKPTIRGDWMAAKWGVRRGFIKLHIGVDAKTKKIYAVVITDDKCGDSPQFKELVEQAFANAEKTPNAVTSADTAVAADGAYDTKKIRGYCDDHNICPLIPIRIDFAGNANGCMPRKKEGFRQLAGVEHIDKDAEHMFADLTRDQKREHQREWRKKAALFCKSTVKPCHPLLERRVRGCVSPSDNRLCKTLQLPVSYARGVSKQECRRKACV